MLSEHSLVVTVPPSNSIISLNNVKITTGSPIYDDGFLIILEVKNLFDPNYQLVAPISVPFPDLICGSSSSANGTSTIGFPGASWFEGARGVLRSNGYAVMASFFDLQLVGFKNPSMLTIFASLDQAMENPLKDLLEFSFSFGDLIFSDCLELPDFSFVFSYI
ncbi:hypothetical protein M0R45_002673 [Rubus argutus]|uniref:Uncharacterized protein n=1 Tax=Rubus argutus TaxID=59490 RepID=A0AAW1VRH4_RUBAR